MAIENIKILGAVLELQARQHCQSSPFTKKMGQIGGAAFHFFNCPWCWIFISCEIYCYPMPRTFFDKYSRFFFSLIHTSRTLFYFQDMDHNEMEGFEITEAIDNDEYKTIKNWYFFSRSNLRTWKHGIDLDWIRITSLP